MIDRLKVYHALPYPLRVMAASARGYYLNWWRYGTDTEQFMEQAKEREAWSQDQWGSWQQERLAFILDHAVKNVPYYRDYWAARRRKGDKTSYNYLENWPVLNKEQVRQYPFAFLADSCNPNRMFRDSTSGSTGTPIHIYLNRKTIHEMYALFEARVRNWHGVSRKDRWAIMGGQLVVPFNQDSPPYWVFNAGLNQLYLSTHHISIKTAEAYINKLREFKPSHMLVYPSSAAILALAVIEMKLTPPPLKVIFSNAEPLTEMQKDTIQQAFDCRLVNTYGMAEGVTGACECAEECMHFWPEVGFLEVFEDNTDDPVKDTGGRFVSSSLLNMDMPLIRYDVGDRGQLSWDKACKCGRRLPCIKSIEGRSNDLIVTRDGRRIFWINPAFYGLPIREAQVIQEALGSIVVRFVPASHHLKDIEKILIGRLQDRLGDMEIRLEAVEQIPRSSSGKFRAVISKINLR